VPRLGPDPDRRPGGDLQSGEVLKPTPEEQIHNGGIEIHVGQFFDRFEAEARVNRPPLVGRVVAIQAGHPVWRVGRPVDERDALLRQGACDGMVLDDDQPGADPDALAQEPIKVRLVVQNIGEDDDVAAVVFEGDVAPLVFENLDRLAAAFDALQPPDLKPGGSVRGVEKRLAQRADAATDIEHGVILAQVRRDPADEFAQARFVHRTVHRVHEFVDRVGGHVGGNVSGKRRAVAPWRAVCILLGVSSTISNPDSKRAIPIARLRALLVLTLAYALLVIPVILSGRGGTNEAGDARRYHEPVIETMVEQWPSPDIVNYRSTTSPGYHLLMAGLMKLTGAETVDAPVVRFTNALLTWILVTAIFWWASAFCGAWLALALTTPALLSSYTLGGGIWLTTDASAWAFIALAVGGAVATTRATPMRMGMLGLCATLAVGIRQVHVWAIAPIGLLAVLSGPLRGWIPRGIRIGDDPARASWGRFAWGMVCALTPAALLACFVMIWGGLTPPEYRDKHNVGANSATFAFALSLCAVFGVYFLPAALDEIKRGALKNKWLWICVGIGLLAAIVPATDWVRIEHADGSRWNPRDNGWLWKPIVQRAPDLFGRTSVVILLLAPMGAGVVWLLRQAAESAGRGAQANVLLLTTLGWLGAQSMNSLAWQRYFEPMILMGLIWLTAMALPRGTDAKRVRLTVVGALVLAGFQALLVGVTLYREVFFS